MNIVHELRIKKGIQQKELALELGVSSAAVSNWEKGKSDPSGDRLKKVADYFGVDENVVLGYGLDKHDLFVPANPQISGKSETDQILERLLEKLDQQPKTDEAKILASGVDKLSQNEREQALAVVKAMFSHYSNYFEKGKSQDDSET